MRLDWRTYPLTSGLTKRYSVVCRATAQQHEPHAQTTSQPERPCAQARRVELETRTFRLSMVTYRPRKTATFRKRSIHVLIAPGTGRRTSSASGSVTLRGE